MKSADDFGARIFSRYFVKSSKTIIAANEEWLKLEMSKESWERPQGCDGYGPQGVRYCVNFVGVHAYLVDSEVTYQTENPGADGAALLAHEYFHLVQSNLTGKPGELPSQGFDSQSRNSIPAWLIEGSAEFVGFMVAAKSLKGNYLLGRSAMLNYSPRNYEVSANALKDYEVRIGREGDQTYIYPYHVGQVATEYIVASKGFQALLDIFISYSKTKNFDESFKSALGISKSEFYEKFEQIRTKAGLPPVTWRLDVDVNKKINP
ncbi:MAG: hypothetical protein EB043_03795 [Actinobacteria bacterium]|nr:hypothetical protein [Actinomycetota bacterium]